MQNRLLDNGLQTQTPKSVTYFKKAELPLTSLEIFGKELRKIKEKALLWLCKSPVHPHVGNCMLLFSPLKRDTIEREENKNKDNQQYKSTEVAFRWFKDSIEVYKIMKGMGKAAQD